MFVRQAGKVEPKVMEMEGASGVSMRLLVGRDDGAPNFAMRWFELEPGGHTPRHKHNYEHEVIIVDGRGEMSGEGQVRTLASGDAVYIPANEAHQFRNTGTQVLKFVCMVPTTHDCGSVRAPTPGS